MRRLVSTFCVAILPFATLALSAAAQQSGNILYPTAAIERLMRDAEFTVGGAQGSRGEGDRTSQMTLIFLGETVMIAKFAPAPINGGTYNNEPRHELAAYELQKLFLPEHETVVPPTVARAFPVDWVREYDYRAEETFDDTDATVVVLQYWLLSVTPDDFWDDDRFEADTVYARYLANMNVLTHLINHVDANVGNFLISSTPVPRVFSVDNGVSFRSPASDQGSAWRRLRKDALPHATVERLRTITPEDLTRTLGILAQFEMRDGRLAQVEPTENLDANRGVRERDGVIQLGMTRGEIDDVRERLERLLRRVDEGDITVF